MIDNLFAGLPSTAAVDEQFSELLRNPALRIERIASNGQSSPPGFWYDQPEGEWVLLLQGEARLRLADEPQARHLRAGDFINLAPHCRHRVDWTPPDQTTIWLAIYYNSTQAG